jgi:hypothetical protein
MELNQIQLIQDKMEETYLGYKVHYSYRYKLIEALKKLWFVRLWRWLFK